MPRLDARVVVITGAGYGIGRGIARLFASRGDAVVIADRDSQRGRAAEGEIRSKGGQAVFIAADVRDEISIRGMFEAALADWGRLDVLVNNAGIERYARADEYTTDDFDAIFETNLRGMFLCARYAFPHLREQRGSIVNVSSVQGVANEPNISVYAGAKAGILGLTRGMAIDFAPFGVRVNAVLPGATNHTGMMEDALGASPDAASVIAAVNKAIPLGRMGEPEDVAGAVYFLSGPEASYITGAALPIDGGLLARLAV